MATDWKHELEHSQRYPFKDWKEVKDRIPKEPGVYTVWDQKAQLLYVGTAGDGQEGLRGRLNQHARGKRHQDKFCVYIADRFILRSLSQSEIDRIDAGRLELDDRVKEHVRDNLAFRYATMAKKKAKEIEKRIQAGRWPGGTPWLNPS